MISLRRDRPELGPLLGCAALALLIGLQLVLPPKGLPQDDVGLAVRRPRLLAAPQAPDVARVLAAPIFAPDRRPGEAVLTAAGEAHADALSGYSALGVVASPRGTVVFMGAPGGATRSLRPGDVLEGWRLAGANLDQVVFERQGVRRVFVVGAPAAPSVQSGASTSDSKGVTP